MTTFLNLFITSFSQLLSSPSFTLIAKKSVLGAVKYSELPESLSGPTDDIQLHDLQRLARDLGCTYEEKNVGGCDIDLDAALRRSLSALSLKSPLNTGSGTTPVPFNTPTLTPSDSFGQPILQSQEYFDSPLYSKLYDMSHSSRFGSLSASTSTSACDASEASQDLDDELRGLLIREPSSKEKIPSDPSSSPRGHKPVNLAKGVGLGITGTSKQDGKPVDGLGLVSIRRWSDASRLSRMTMDSIDNPMVQRRSLLEDVELDETRPLLPNDDGGLSETFLNEALITFTHDPLHEHSLSTIPECRSWYELDLGEDDLSHSASAETEGFASNETMPPKNPATLMRTKRHFSSSTISSELKRASFRRAGFSAAARTRSATWPRHEGSESLASRSGRAWRA